MPLWRLTCLMKSEVDAWSAACFRSTQQAVIRSISLQPSVGFGGVSWSPPKLSRQRPSPVSSSPSCISTVVQRCSRCKVSSLR